MAFSSAKRAPGKIWRSISKFYNTKQKSSMMDGSEEYFGDSHVRETAVTLAEKSRFEKSKTVSNVVLPLKTTRMAKPFPDPVKSMRSQIISDRDKREQMYADSKQHVNGLSGSYYK